MRPLWHAASFLVVLYVGWMLLAGVFHPRLAWFASPGFHLRPVLLYLCLDGFALALSAAYLCGLDGQSFRALGLWFHRGWFRQITLGTAWGAGVISGTVLLLIVAHAAAIPLPNVHPLPHFLSLLVFLLLAATFEELTFRGYLFQRASDALGTVFAVLLTSLLFGLAHYGNPEATSLSTLNTVLAGVLLAVARFRSRALWMPIGLHFSWNFFLGPVFSFPVSGFTFGMESLASSSTAPVWFTGGAYGPEGGAALTAILAGGILLAMRLPAPVASLGAGSGVD